MNARIASPASIAGPQAAPPAGLSAGAAGTAGAAGAAGVPTRAGQPASGAAIVSPLPPGSVAAPAIHRLSGAHLDALLRHFMALGEEDRTLRFGGQVSDRIVEGYVRSLNFEDDAVFGVFDADLELIAAGHLASLPTENGRCTAELGISASESARRRGIGSRLLERAALYSRNHEIDRLYLHCRADNRGMLRIARRAGMSVSISYGEADAYLDLLPANQHSLFSEWVEQQTAAFDYAFKHNASQASRLLQWWSPLKHAA